MQLVRIDELIKNALPVTEGFGKEWNLVPMKSSANIAAENTYLLRDHEGAELSHIPVRVILQIVTQDNKTHITVTGVRINAELATNNDYYLNNKYNCKQKVANFLESYLSEEEL